RDDHDGPVAQVTGGRAKDRVLEVWSGRLEDSQCAVRVIAGPAVGQAAQGEAGEFSGADGVLGAAGRDLPPLPRSADEYVQDAVDVDDLDKHRGAELIEQLCDVDDGPARVGYPAGLQRAGTHHALEAQLLALERARRQALPPRLLQPA